MSPTAALCTPPALPGSVGWAEPGESWGSVPFCGEFSHLGKEKEGRGGGVLPPALHSAGAGPGCKGRRAGFGGGGLPASAPPSPGLAASPEVAARREDTRPVLPPLPSPPAPGIHPRSPPTPPAPPGRPARAAPPVPVPGGLEMAAGARRPPRHLLPPGPPPCTPAPLPPSSAPVPASSRRCRGAAAASKDEPGPTAAAGPLRQPRRRGPILPAPGAAPEDEERAGKSRAPGGTRSPAGHVGTEQRRSRKYRAGWGQPGPRRALPPPRHRRQELLRMGWGGLG